LVKPTWIGRSRHLTYFAGWKKFEFWCDRVIRIQRVGQMLPLLEAILAGRGCQSGSQSSPVETAGKRNRALSELTP